MHLRKVGSNVKEIGKVNVPDEAISLRPHCYAPITKHNNLFVAVGLVSNGLIASVEFVSFCITVGYDGTQSLLAPCFIAQATYILFWKETGNVHVCGATSNTPHCCYQPIA